MDNLDELLNLKLKDIGKEKCPKCGRVIDRGDVAWNTGCTEYGTPYSVMEIICQACDTEIYMKHTWYEIESLDEFIHCIENIDYFS